MLHVLVNNDYQLRAFLRHFSGRRDDLASATLVAVPHKLTLGQDAGAFGRTVVLQSPQGRVRMPRLAGAYRAAQREVEQQLRPAAGDVLVFFTEVEWLNHLVVQRFKACGARVVLLEDGGFGTYIPMGQPASDPLGWRERLALAALRRVPALRHSRLFKVNGVLFPRLPDTAIDWIALYRDVHLHRDTPVRLVAQPARQPCSVRTGTAVFLNEPLYDYYQTREAYFAGLDRLLGGLDCGFATVHFKFHPRESAAWRDDIRGHVQARFPRIRFVDSDLDIERLMADYRPEVLASFFSSALLGIEHEGVEPMYLYHLVDDLAGQPVFEAATRILRSWGYRFVASVDDIRSGFRAGLADSRTGADDFAALVAGPTPATVLDRAA